MPIDIDGYAVLGAISRDRNTFSAIHSEVSKAARSLVVKQLKDKSITLDGLKAITTAIARDNFNLILDQMSEAEIKSLLTKIDKFNVEAKQETPQSQRKQVSNLASGLALPTIKSAAANLPKTKRQSKPKVERAVNSKAMRAKKKV